MKRVIPFIIVSIFCLQTSLRAQEPSYTPTWAKDIAPILYKNCVECHRPDQVAPFSLLEYQDAAKRARFIARVTSNGYMPPWSPSGPKGAFHDERELTLAEIELISLWAEGGAPAGDLQNAPEPPVFEERKWTLGEPDLVLKMPRSYHLDAQAEDIYRVFPMPFSIEDVPDEIIEKALLRSPYGPETDKLAVKAIEILAGNRRVLHHADVWLDTTGTAMQREAEGGEVGFTSFGTPGFPAAAYLGGKLPGFKPRFLPEGVAAALIPVQGSDLALQIHYSPTGKPEEDQSEVGIYFMREEALRVMESLFLRSFDLDIPPGESDFVVRDELVIPTTCYLLNIFPHMHLLGKSVYATATFPDGTTRTLIEMDAFRFNWQNFYVYKEPIILPKGTRIDCVWTFDNSEANKSNPNDPPRLVSFGPNSDDEMCELHLGVVPVDLAEWDLIPQAREAKMQQKINELSPEQRARFDWSTAWQN